ncbi:MAG: hypothetical protein QXJ17_01860 [Nitrososphaeria archaeon]
MWRTTLPIALLLITLTATLIPVSVSQTPRFYNENITVYIVGKTALTRLNFTGTEVGFKDLGKVEESSPTISYYKLYVGQFKSWPSEYLYFTSSGLNIILSNYLSSSGAFLYVKADSLDAALSFAAKLGNFTGLSFTQFGNLEGMYVFISPLNFNEVLENFLWNSYPVSYGGFANLISINSLKSQTSPQYTLIGQKRDDVFVRSIIIDFLKTQAYSGNTIGIGPTFFQKNKVSTSNQSSSSTLKIVSYGQFIVSTDAGSLKNDLRTRHSELTITSPSSSTLLFPNITISPSIPSLLVTRDVSQAALQVNEEFEVQIKIQNIGNLTALNVSFNDDWWSKNFKFSLVTGTPSGQVDSLAPGESRTFVYRLRVSSNLVEEVYVPPLEAKYSVKIAGEEAQLSCYTNDLFLALNGNNPSIYLTAQTSSATTSFGTPNQILVKVTNKGKYAALNLNFAGQAISVLSAGDSWQTTIPVPIDDLASSNTTKEWSITWSDGSQIKTSRSNSVFMINSYDSMKIPLVSVTKEVYNVQSGGKTYLNITIKVQNLGTADLFGVTLSDIIADGLIYVNGTFPGKEKMVAFIDTIKNGETKTFNYILEVFDYKRNYILPPATVSYNIGGMQFLMVSTTDGVPIGVTMTLNLKEREAFSNYNATGYYILKNDGDKDIFRIETDLKIDPSFEILSPNYTSKKALLTYGSEHKVEFTLMFKGEGYNKEVYSRCEFFFAGKRRSVNSSKLVTNVYPTPKILIDLKAEAVEGQVFELEVVVKNQANLTLTDIEFNINLPSQLDLVEGDSSVKIPSLGGEEQKVLELKLMSKSPMSYKIETTPLKFNYMGQSFTAAPSSLTISVSDNITFRYLLPLLIALVATAIAAIIIAKTKK